MSARLFPASVLLALIAAAAAAQTTAPTTPVGSTSAVQTATLTFTENASVTSINLFTQGAPNLDFRFASGGTCNVGTAYAIGQICTVDYTFNPTRPGTRYGAVALYDSSSPANAAATTYLQGTGNGPQAVFSPASEDFLGSGLHGPTHVAVDGSGDVFVADYDGGGLVEILAAGGYRPLNTQGLQPYGVAVDGSGNLFITEPGNQTVRELPAGEGYSTIKTLGSGFSGPQGLAVDGSGNIFVIDDSSVKEITAASGYNTVKTLGSSCDCAVWDIAVDGSGNLFVTAQGSLSEIPAASGYTTVRTIASSLPQGGSLNDPGGVAVDGDGNVYISVNPGCTLNGRNCGPGPYRVREYTAKSNYISSKIVASEPENDSAPYDYLWGLALDGAGNIFLADRGGRVIRKLDFGDPPSLTFATTVAGSTSTDSPQTATISNNGNQALNFSAVSYGHDFPEASGVATDCTSSTTLGISGSCTLSIDFSPLRTSATGPNTPLSEQVTLTDNNLNVTNATQSVAVSGTETFTPPALTTPTPGTTIGSSSATFTWNPGSANTFQFRLGTTPGSNNIYGSGRTNATSATVSNLPTGVNIYAVLYYMLDGAWKSLDYTYPGTPQAPKLTSPAPGSTLSGSTVTFTWNPGTATTFQFRLGTTLGSNNIYGSGQTAKTSETVSNLPTNGETIHAVLYYMVNGAWQYTAYTYSAQ